MIRRYLKLVGFLLILTGSPTVAAQEDIEKAIARDYEEHLAALFDHFHRNPELSLMEFKTAARLAEEFRELGFEVTEGVGGTGVVSIMRNGAGPLVMIRADMDGLPVEEKSGLPNASKVRQVDTFGNEVPVMHACGHDVHITSLVGTGRYMAAHKERWSGTLMLLAQPAEERAQGARAMMEDGIWERFGLPDYALAFHVRSEVPAGQISAVVGSPYSGVDMVNIIVHGVGTHGASPHRGKDPIVLASQIVLALQTIVSRELPPREAGLITVGSFHAGSKHNIISDRATLQLTVRNDNLETRELLLSAIKRVAENTGRAAGLPEDKLPEVHFIDEWAPPTVNDAALVQRLRGVWTRELGEGVLYSAKRLDMGGEDFPFFTLDPYIPSVYFDVGGTPQADFDRQAAGGEPVPAHHSPLFKIDPHAAVTLGSQATVTALLELMPPS